MPQTPLSPLCLELNMQENLQIAANTRVLFGTARPQHMFLNLPCRILTIT